MPRTGVCYTHKISLSRQACRRSRTAHAATHQNHTRPRLRLGCVLSRGGGDRGVAVHAARLLAQRARDRRGRHRLHRDRRHARRARGADLARRSAADNARLEDERRRAEVLGDGRLGLGLALDIVAEDELGRVRVRVRVRARARARASSQSSVGRGEGRDRAGLG